MDSEASGELEAEPMLNMARAEGAGVPPDVVLLTVSGKCGGVLAGGDDDSDVNEVCDGGDMGGCFTHVVWMVSLQMEKTHSPG